jgi:hypothetical protein
MSTEKIALLEARIGRLEYEIGKIHARNVAVAKEKTWERSWQRTLLLVAGTYSVSSVLLYLLGTPKFLTNALVPTTGFYISTITLPVIRRRWMQSR